MLEFYCRSDIDVDRISHDIFTPMGSHRNTEIGVKCHAEISVERGRIGSRAGSTMIPFGIERLAFVYIRNGCKLLVSGSGYHIQLDGWEDLQFKFHDYHDL